MSLDVVSVRWRWHDRTTAADRELIARIEMVSATTAEVSISIGTLPVRQAVAHVFADRAAGLIHVDSPGVVHITIDTRAAKTPATRTLLYARCDMLTNLGAAGGTVDEPTIVPST